MRNETFGGTGEIDRLFGIAANAFAKPESA